MEKQIMRAKQEASTRKEIIEKMEKWMSACEEEGWLEDYNKVCYKKCSNLSFSQDKWNLSASYFVQRGWLFSGIASCHPKVNA
jgi:hypothetical protein